MRFSTSPVALLIVGLSLINGIAANWLTTTIRPHLPIIAVALVARWWINSALYAYEKDAMKQAVIQEKYSLCLKGCTFEQAERRSSSMIDCLFGCRDSLEEGEGIDGETL